jgi:uncharacterized protein (TIGR02145 family)
LTGCGYLYNYYTATAGSYSQAAYVATTRNATGSICPANWRLPSGYDATGDFAILNASMNAGAPTAGSTANTSDYRQNWQPTGAFAGALSGAYTSSFVVQGSYGDFWSTSVDGATNAYYLEFSSSYLDPGTRFYTRNNGMAVRCVTTGGTPSTPTTPTVTFDGLSATNVSLSSDGKTLTATTPAHAAGLVDVVVDNGVDTPTTLTNAYAYRNLQITPDNGPTTGGTTVTITGNFDPAPITMQTMTQGYCAKMPVYPATGSTITLTDTRNNQQYQVRKLADNNCWMIDNLKIANYHTTATDTDLNTGTVATNGFTIPALDTTGGSSLDNSMVYGPVPGDTGLGDTNYGYLYNWPVATAGESTTSMPGDGTNNDIAPNSICPRNWRLPTGDSYPNGDFNQLNIAMYNDGSGTTSSNYYDSDHAANWQFTGPWRGVFSGYWWSWQYEFDQQGGFGMFWASNADPNYTIFLGFVSDHVGTDGGLNSRDYGAGVRCLVSDSQAVDYTVTFDGVPATNISVSSDGKTITATTPAHAAGSVDVVIDNGIDTPATMTNAYTYREPMAITSISPNYGLETGGATITITGNNITPPVPATPTTMQQMSQAYCASMTVYNGSNSSAILTLNDPRNNQQYQIAKLADNNCWMLNNLKLGSTTSTIQLTPADTNIQANWTLPQINNADSVSSYYDTPHLYSLISGDGKYDATKPNSQETDITSQNFAGNYYNWCAATAGGTASGGSDTCTPKLTVPSDATGDICPVNWRLPRGGYYGTNNEFSQLSAKMAGFADNQDSTYQSNYKDYYANWQFAGPFKGVLAGSRIGSSWEYQGGTGFFWSSLPNRGDSYGVLSLSINLASVNPGGWFDRSRSFSVRCLAPGGDDKPTVTLDTGANTIQGTVTAWNDTSITVTVPAHTPGLVSVTVNNGVDSVTLPATCSSANTTACNGRLDPGETRHSDRDNIASGFLYEEVYLSLVLGSDNVQIGSSTGLTPTTTGAFGSGTNTLTAATNNPKGYVLSISTDQPSSNTNASDMAHQSITNTYLLSTANTCNWNTATNTLTNTTTPLGNNTWGFTLNPANLASQQLCQAPNQNSPLTVKSTTTPDETGDNTTFYYGTKINLEQVAGEYKARVVYLVMANP